MLASALSPTLTFKLSITSLLGQFDFQHGDNLCSAIWICLIADGWHRLGSVNGIECFVVAVLSCWGLSWLSSMLWALHVLDLLLDLNLECLPLGLWHLSVLLPWDGLLLLLSPWLFCFDLQQMLKWFLCPHLWHLFTKYWTFSWLVWCAALAACFTWAFSYSVAVACVAFLVFEGSDFINCWCYHGSTIELVSVEVLYCHFVLFGMCWRSDSYVTSSLFFFDLTHFLTLKCLVTWKSNSVLHTSFSASLLYWHLSTMFLVHWSKWSVDSCSHCLMSLYILSMCF